MTHGDSGHGVEECEADYSAEAMEIGFNARYLLDVCQQIENDTVRIEFQDTGAPARVLDALDPGAQYVLMPLRV